MKPTDYAFYEGQELQSIWYEDRAITVGKNGIVSITVVMENGQMAAVPWAYALYEDKPSEGIYIKYNLALALGIKAVTPKPK